MTEPETEPPAESFELEGWKCEELSGFGVGCVGYPVARAVRKGGLQVCLTNDNKGICYTNDDSEQAEHMPEAVRAWLLEGRKP